MKLPRGLIFVALSLPAAIAAGPARAASDCIELKDSRPGEWCTGQLAALSVRVRNDCSSPGRVGFTFAIDHESIRAKAESVVPAGDEVAKVVHLTLPPTMRSGRHTLTVTVTDAAGNASSTEQTVFVASCGAP
jgi:hypothetical protein